MNTLSHCLSAAVLLISPATLALGEMSYLLSTSGSSRATGYAETNKIVTYGGKTHVAWLDSSDDGFEVMVRSYDHASRQWSPGYSVGPARDNHGGPALAVDGDGYLHVVYYPHSDPLRYRKSLRPNDASEWTPEVQFGDRLTYPTFLVGPDNTLYLTARYRGVAEQPWELQMFSKRPNEAWSTGTTILRAGEKGYSHFQAALAWGPGHQTLHLCTRMYGDSPRWGYLLGYMKSSDFGKTWQRLDGSPIGLPATKAVLDVIEAVDPTLRRQFADSSALRGGGLVVGADNRPYVLYNTLQADGSLPRRAWLATPDENRRWQRTALNEKLDALAEGWGLGMPGGIVLGDHGKMFLVLTAANDVAERSLWGSKSSEVIWAESGDGGQTFTSQMVSQLDAATPHWLANIERPTGFNQMVGAPSVVYLVGERGENNQQTLQNRVMFWNQDSTW